MPNTYTAVTKQEGVGWFGWIEEVPGVNCQEKTHDKLLESLKSTLREATVAFLFVKAEVIRESG